MNENRIAEIRKRHAFADEHKSVIRPSGFSWTVPGWQAHNDRATLLAEVERLQGLLKGLSRDMAEEIEKLTRERDEARAALKPFSELYLWPDDAGRLIAERVRSHEDWDEEVNEEESNPYCILRGEIRAARKALEAKPPNT